MEIISGLFDHMVLQRNKRNFSDSPVVGKCSSAGIVKMTVKANRRTLPGVKSINIGCAERKRFHANLKHIPTGGPYDIELKITSKAGAALETHYATDILVGDIWILAGQSNMEGIGLLNRSEKPNKLVRAFYMHDRWAPAKDPIHNLGQAIEPIHTYINDGIPVERQDNKGTGPGVAFGKYMHKKTNVPQGLIASAHGGTSMQQWDPALKSQPGKSLYAATINRVAKNGGRVAGLIWYQGCSDATDKDAAPLYTKRMKKLIKAFRRDLKAPQLPVTTVQIARHIIDDTSIDLSWNSIQEQQRLLPQVIDRLTVVPAIDLSLDDGIHISGKDQQRLGRRLAKATLSITQRPRVQKTPITFEPKKIKITRERVSNMAIIELQFGNIVDRLQSLGRPTGFALVNQQNKSVSAIYKTELLGNRVRLYTTLLYMELSAYRLHFGFGKDTYCNITDADDRSLPVFGPITITTPPARRGP